MPAGGMARTARMLKSPCAGMLLRQFVLARAFARATREARPRDHAGYPVDDLGAASRPVDSQWRHEGAVHTSRIQSAVPCRRA
jgi:hypothetical protein